MALNNKDRQAIKAKAADYGYKPSQLNADKYIQRDGSGKSLTFSTSGGSVNFDGSKYTEKSDALKSKKW